MKPSIKIIEITVYFLILLILFPQMTLADDTGTELKGDKIESIPGVPVKELAARQEVVENIIEIKQISEDELAEYLTSPKDEFITIPDDSKCLLPSSELIDADKITLLADPITPLPIPPPPEPTSWSGPIPINPPTSPIVTRPFLTSYRQIDLFNHYSKNYPRFGASFVMITSLKKTYDLTNSDDGEEDTFYYITLPD